MKYAKIKENDIANAPGVCVSVYLQGCPHHCYNCFNPETWDFNGGLEFTSQTMDYILKALTKNNVKRDLCLLGGEPLCEDNQFLTLLIIKNVKEKYPDTKIYIWTGYVLEKAPNSKLLEEILYLTDVIIDGPFIQQKKDITLKMRGSSNQRILYKGKDF